MIKRRRVADAVACRSDDRPMQRRRARVDGNNETGARECLADSGGRAEAFREAGESRRACLESGVAKPGHAPG
eukprot:1802752-Pleurochrysis_carterae.AAC.2